MCKQTLLSFVKSQCNVTSADEVVEHTPKNYDIIYEQTFSLIYSDSSDGNDDHEQLEEVTSLSRKHRVEARAKWGVGWQEGNEDKHRAGGN